MSRLFAVLWLALLVIATPAYAQNLPPRPDTPVLDQAGLLRPEQALDIRSKAEALYARTGRTFFVATVSSLHGMTIEDYGNRLIRAWKVGDEKRDDGIILIVAPNEKKVRIETGYGAEAFLTDIVAGRIIRDTILPRFRAGDLAGGVVAGAQQIIETVSLPEAEAQRRAEQIGAEETRRADDGPNFLPIVFWVIVVLFVLMSMGRGAGGRRYRSRRHDRAGISPWVVLWGLNELSRASRGRGGWGGGLGGGGGFGGFGGGGFGGGGFGGFGGSGGGGGASGSW